MNVEIGAEAALFPEKEYINGISVAVQAVKWTRARYDFSPFPAFTDNNFYFIFYFF